MISKYQAGEFDDFRALMKAAEALQLAQNPEYKSIEFVLDKAGKTE